jgi:hypothetical protein
MERAILAIIGMLAAGRSLMFRHLGERRPS